MDEADGEVEVGADDGWEPRTFLADLTREFDRSGFAPAAGFAYIGGLARAQEAAWQSAEEEIAEAVFAARYRDPVELWGEMTERERGLSWEALAQALLVSRETARKRFRDRVEAIRNERVESRAAAQEAFLEARENEGKVGGE